MPFGVFKKWGSRENIADKKAEEAVKIEDTNHAQPKSKEPETEKQDISDTTEATDEKEVSGEFKPKEDLPIIDDVQPAVVESDASCDKTMIIHEDVEINIVVKKTVSVEDLSAAVETSTNDDEVKNTEVKTSKENGVAFKESGDEKKADAAEENTPADDKKPTEQLETKDKAEKDHTKQGCHSCCIS